MIASLAEILPAESPNRNPETIERALRYAFFDPDRAAVFLHTSIPDRPMSFISAEPDFGGVTRERIDRGDGERDKAAMRRIRASTHANAELIVQCYMASDKDEQKALDLVRSIMSTS